MELTVQQRQALARSQTNEITEYLTYRGLAKEARNKANRHVLERIAAEELKHYHFWKNYTKREVAPNRLKFYFCLFLARIFGLNFGVK